MAKPKSEQRKLAELVAKQRGIKVKSAQNWLYRVSAGKVKKPKYDLTDYAKRKVKKFVSGKKAERKKREAPAPRRDRPERRIYSFSPGERQTIAVKAEYNFYGSDRRTRTIRFELFGDELARFLNAENEREALDTLAASNAGAFLNTRKGEASINKFDSFEWNGKTHKEFW